MKVDVRVGHFFKWTVRTFAPLCDILHYAGFSVRIPNKFQGRAFPPLPVHDEQVCVETVSRPRSS